MLTAPVTKLYTLALTFFSPYCLLFFGINSVDNEFFQEVIILNTLTMLKQIEILVYTARGHTLKGMKRGEFRMWYMPLT